MIKITLVVCALMFLVLCPLMINSSRMSREEEQEELRNEVAKIYDKQEIK